MYDCIIIGGGPAGLSAAIYLGRFLRKVIVLDKGHARSTYPQINYNYLGFPDGIPSRTLREKGKQQALHYNVTFTDSEVIYIKQQANTFNVKTTLKILQGKTIILATGVSDNFPSCNDIEKCVGISLYWCITCDGYKTSNKRVLVVGNTNEAAETAMQLLNYTNDVLFITNGETKLSKKWQQRLRSEKITIHENRIINIVQKEGMIKNVILNNGSKISLDLMFSLQGAQPNSKLAKILGVKVNKKGYIKVNSEQRTSIPRVYAAGDVTNMFSQQVVTAAHEGSMAAQSANYDLYSTNQKE